MLSLERYLSDQEFTSEKSTSFWSGAERDYGLHTTLTVTQGKESPFLNSGLFQTVLPDPLHNSVVISTPSAGTEIVDSVSEVIGWDLTGMKPL